MREARSRVGFGTDGLRGVAGEELTPELMMALGRSAARVLGDGPFLVGRDTRWSGPMIQAALSAGLAAEGADVVDLGVVPTPVVAALSAEHGLPGAVLSASHNPFADNGVKLFAPGGLKLGLELERQIEAGMQPDEQRRNAGPPRSGRGIGRLRSDPGGRAWYCGRVVGALEGRTLAGTRVALDCANGAATTTAEQILRAAGADVVAVLGAAPDGTNINASRGSTDPSELARTVVDTRADAGLALDGDADRLIAVDGAGAVVDGDRLLALFAIDMHTRGALSNGTVVVTVMTNLGFHQAMRRGGIDVCETPVGDRHVLEALEAGGHSLGGEQSGHIIFRDLATTGDGVLSGLLLLDLVARAGRPLADLAVDAMDALPQVLRNVPVDDPSALEGAETVWDEVRAVEQSLGSSGRVLLRPSGTEKAVRIMVEAATEAEADSVADRLAGAVGAALCRVVRGTGQ